jgi:hypothetical protein
MDFPDMNSLMQRATQRDFRQPHEGETEVQFRAVFADFMKPIDLVESMEIRTSRGWDNMNAVQTTEMLSQQVGGLGELFKFFMAAETMIDKVIKEDNEGAK